MLLKICYISKFFRTPSIRQQRFSSLVLYRAIHDLICSIYFFVFGVVSILSSIGTDGFTNMSNLTCFYLYMPVVLSANTGHFTNLVMSIDTFISVKFPFFYMSINDTYITGFICCSWLFGMVNLCFGKNVESLILFHPLKTTFLAFFIYQT